MAANVSPEGKMKAGVFVKPRKGKEWLILVLMIITILPTFSPLLDLWNVPTLILGMPVFLFVSIITLLDVLAVILLAMKLEVY
jgi:protein-S-isoprenylcysteine O-methyltransferase Ste14